MIWVPSIRARIASTCSTASAYFLRKRYRSSIDTKECIFTAVANGQIGVEIGGSREAHTRIAHQSLHEAQSMLELFEHTIVAHLGTAGPMGAIAEQQLRILARLCL